MEERQFLFKEKCYKFILLEIIRIKSEKIKESFGCKNKDYVIELLPDMISSA